MTALRLLVLDDEAAAIFISRASRHGVEVEVTAIEEEIGHALGYKLSAKGKELAAHADQFNAVIIGNNMDTGLVYARLIPAAVRNNVLVVWNEYKPGDEIHYAELGFSHFASRWSDEMWEWFSDVINRVKLFDGFAQEALQDIAAAEGKS